MKFKRLIQMSCLSISGICLAFGISTADASAGFVDRQAPGAYHPQQKIDRNWLVAPNTANLAKKKRLWLTGLGPDQSQV
jgi:hypothetical protein